MQNPKCIILQLVAIFAAVQLCHAQSAADSFGVAGTNAISQNVQSVDSPTQCGFGNLILQLSNYLQSQQAAQQGVSQQVVPAQILVPQQSTNSAPVAQSSSTSIVQNQQSSNDNGQSQQTSVAQSQSSIVPQQTSQSIGSITQPQQQTINSNGYIQPQQSTIGLNQPQQSTSATSSSFSSSQQQQPISAFIAPTYDTPVPIVSNQQTIVSSCQSPGSSITYQSYVPYIPLYQSPSYDTPVYVSYPSFSSSGSPNILPIYPTSANSGNVASSTTTTSSQVSSSNNVLPQQSNTAYNSNIASGSATSTAGASASTLNQNISPIYNSGVSNTLPPSQYYPSNTPQVYYYNQNPGYYNPNQVYYNPNPVNYNQGNNGFASGNAGAIGSTYNQGNNGLGIAGASADSQVVTGQNNGNYGTGNAGGYADSLAVNDQNNGLAYSDAGAFAANSN